MPIARRHDDFCAFTLRDVTCSRMGMRIMKALAVATLVATGFLAAGPGHADGSASPRTMRETEVREISARRYTELLRLACFNGFRYREGDIRRGYHRHFEELRLALLGQGYTILPDAGPAQLVVASIATGQMLHRNEGSEPGCFRARWSDPE